MQKLSVVKNADVQSFLNLSAFEVSNWVNIKTLNFKNTVPVGSFDISDCDKFKVVVKTSAASGDIRLVFDADTGSNYKTDLMYSATGASVGASAGVTPGWLLISNITNGYSYLEFSKYTKSGIRQHTYGSTPSIQVGGVLYVGSSPMNTLNIETTSNTFTGSISVYKWQDCKISTLASYELVKELSLNNQVLNETFDYDGESHPDLVIMSDYVTASSAWIGVRPNNDTGLNYSYAYIGNSSTSGATGNFGSSQPALYASNGGSLVHSKFEANLRVGTKRSGICYDFRETTFPWIDLLGSFWANTTTPVTSLNIYSSSAITGSVIVYRLVTKQLLKQNINPIELVVNKTFNNQPVDITIDVTDCDILDIDCMAVTATNQVALLFNDDNTASHYVYEYVQANNNNPQVGCINALLPIIFGNVNYVESSCKVCPFSKVARVNGTLQSGANWYTTQISSTWNHPGTVTSVRLTSGEANVTGKIKVYKKY